MCSGSVVHKYAVLTAAHCVVTAKSAVIKIGLVDQRAPKSSYDTIEAKIFIWPSTYSYNYRGGVNENDIALIILSKPSRFAPAPMASSKAKLKKLQSTTAIGWGITVETQRTITRYLQTQNFPYLDPNTCKKYSGVNDPKMVCTGLNMKKYKVNICSGDSGGPLLAKNGKKNVIVGVVSGSYGDCGKSYGPNLYSSVALWRTWLDGMIKKYAKARAVVVPKPKPLPPKPRPPPTPKPPTPDYDYDYYDYWWFL
jgi:secreted trypsin-like serine protease